MNTSENAVVEVIEMMPLLLDHTGVSLNNQVPIESDEFATEMDELNKLLHNQKQLLDVKEKLGRIVDSILDNPSILSRAAKIWGELPLWQKYAWGLGLTGVIITIGICTQLPALLIIGGITAIIYGVSSFLLDDHYACNANDQDKLKTGISNLSDVLELIINALDTVRKQLSEQIDSFKKQNTLFEEHLSSMTTQVTSLTTEVESFMITNKFLVATQEQLEAITHGLQEQLGDQTQLFQRSQSELDAVRSDYQKNQEILGKKITDLDHINTQLNKKLLTAQTIADTLSGTVNLLSKQVLPDGERQKIFQQKLDTLMTDHLASFAEVNSEVQKSLEQLEKTKEALARTEATLTRTEIELAHTQEDLHLANERYLGLLNKQEELITRLETIDRELVRDLLTCKKTGNEVNLQALLNHSFYKPQPACGNVIPARAEVSLATTGIAH